MKVVHTSGKRKTAIARGTVREGTGKVRINKVPLELYSPELARLKLTEPLELAGDVADQVDISSCTYGNCKRFSTMDSRHGLKRDLHSI